jgi:hypothetical protein
VFVVFILFLSVLFFGAAATLFKTRNDWRVAYNEYKKATMAKLVGESGDWDSPENGSLVYLVSQQRKRLDERDNEITRLQSANDELGTRLKQANADIEAEKARVVKAQEALAQTTTLSETLAKNLDAETGRSTQLRTDLDEAKAKTQTALDDLAKANGERDALVLDLVQTQKDLHETRREYQELAVKYDDQELWVQHVMSTHPEIARDVSPKIAPPIDALVSAVDNTEKLVVLSVGKDQRVEPGFQFTVARGNSFIGKVEVIKVYPDLSGARIMFTKEGEEVRQGDKAFTVAKVD